MGKVIIAIGIRSEKATEVKPGIYEYTNIVIDKIQGDISDEGYTVEDATSLTQNELPSTKITFKLSNDKTNRLSRIIFVDYLGIRYKVTHIAQSNVRTTVTLGGKFIG